LQVARKNRDAGKTLQKRYVVIFALIENALIEFKPRKLSILHIGKNIGPP
jgi:hypothetical protein